jgi:hypothetical protein
MRLSLVQRALAALQNLVAYCLNDACRHTALIDVSSYPADTEVSRRLFLERRRPLSSRPSGPSTHSPLLTSAPGSNAFMISATNSWYAFPGGFLKCRPSPPICLAGNVISKSLPSASDCSVPCAAARPSSPSPASALYGARLPCSACRRCKSNPVRWPILPVSSWGALAWRAAVRLDAAVEVRSDVLVSWISLPALSPIVLLAHQPPLRQRLKLDPALNHLQTSWRVM